MDDDANDLMAGERPLWSGRPGQGFLLTARDAYLVPFSLLWGGFAVFWETSVVQSNAPIYFRLFGVPFVLAGLYLIAGRFLLDAWVRRNTTYMITNRRIVIHRRGPFSALISFNLDRLPSATLSETSNGRGRIRYGDDVSWPWGRTNLAGWTPALDSAPQFLAIDDAKNVFDRIQRLTSSGADSKAD